MHVLFDDDFHVQYGFIFFSTTGSDDPDLMATRGGQSNGLLGAAVPGVLSLVTGMHSGFVSLRIELLDEQPTLDETSWDEIVEAPLETAGTDATLSSFLVVLVADDATDTCSG